jgi:hypothetical protein
MLEITLDLLDSKWGAHRHNDGLWKILEGNLKCSDCDHLVFPGGGEGPTSNCALAVFGLDKPPPTNFVCPLCRGLLVSNKSP